MRKIFPLIILVTLLTGTIFFSPTCFAVETQTSQEVSIHEPTHDRVWVSSIPKGWYEKKEYVPLTAHHDHIHNGYLYQGTLNLSAYGSTILNGKTWYTGIYDGWVYNTGIRPYNLIQ